MSSRARYRAVPGRAAPFVKMVVTVSPRFVELLVTGRQRFARPRSRALNSSRHFHQRVFADRNSTRKRFHEPGSMILACQFEGTRRY